MPFVGRAGARGWGAMSIRGSAAAIVGARIYAAGMAAEVLDGDTVRRWCRLSVDALAETRAAIDALNVFPVPDADTGTNLHITLMSAAEAVESLPAGAGLAEVWHAAARGALLGACGNSGIIVSQLLRGLADVCAAESPCDGPVMARALTHAAASARAAVSRPAEGTVLTVADAAALAAMGAAGSAGTGAGSAGTGAAGSSGLATVVTTAARAAREALASTCGQLEVLAARGVVDAGAAGLCVLLDALAAAVTGVRPEAFEVPSPAARSGAARSGAVPAGAVRYGEAASPAGPAAGLAGTYRPSSFGYEVTYLLEAPPAPVRQLRERLDVLGDSLVIVGGEDLWNVHVHVADAGSAIEAGLRAGRPRRITVTWLGTEAGNGHGAGGGPEARGVVAVADSDGLAALLRSAGARVLRPQEGDAPAVPALIEAIRQAGVYVAVIPNAPHAARLAQAAAARLGDEGIVVSVIPARSPLQGIAALAVHDPQRGFDADVIAMSQAAAGLRYGSVVGRDGGFAGLDGEEVTMTAQAQGEVAAALATGLLARGGELVTLMEGAGAEPGLARLVADRIGSADAELEVVCYDGGPVPLLIGVE
jgi:DAK2 domain fusion protein YloV